ncbi:hypothetical protein C8J57DRAFT_1227246 [Mycena rebaudengoi]|nr:hypothetical protein C8J57DRAFT_1227246 [Mycena rebaudengoi]
MTSPHPHPSTNSLPTEIHPGESQALSHKHYGTFGTPNTRELDPHEPQIIEHVANQAWAAHLKDEPVQVHPGIIATPQLVYLGRQDINGQETHHGIMLNAQMMVHDPDSGMPGCQNGHTYVRFESAPADDKDGWSREVPYATEEDIRELLSQYTDHITHTPRKDPCPAVFNGVNTKHVPSTESLSPTCGVQATTVPEEVEMAPGTVSPTKSPRYCYISVPVNTTLPFNTLYMEFIGTMHGDAIMHFQLRDDAPKSQDAAKPSSQGTLAQFDTPALPYCLNHHCLPLDDRTRQEPASSKFPALTEVSRLPKDGSANNNPAKM